MSLVYITHHNENVRDYESTDVSQVPRQKKLKYVSSHKKDIKKQINQSYIVDSPDGYKLITDSGKHKNRTMGCARIPPNVPKPYLRKNEGVKWRRLHDHVCVKGAPLEPIPLVSQLPKVICQSKRKSPEDKPGSKVLDKIPRVEKIEKDEKVDKIDRVNKTEKTDKMQQDRRCHRKNFIAINKKIAIQANVKRPIPKFVDTPFGDRQNLVNSGLIPQHVCGKNFAKVPCYLNAHKKLLEQLRASCSKKDPEKDICKKSYDITTQHDVYQMSIQERMKLLEGLKVNYVETLKTFQTMSLYADTPTKMIRKSRLEKELDQLEADIQFLEENPVIYISDF